MLTFPEVDPVALSLGPLKVHWYGITYLIAFSCAWWLGTLRSRKPHSPMTPPQMSDLIFYGAMGTVLGGRLGYMLFYNFGAILDNPLNLFKVWEGGMSYHGGMIGVFIAMWLYGRKLNLDFFTVTDFIAPLVPTGIFAVRMGNFINGELWGRVTDVPWAMVFPDPRAGLLTRHPSQLYEAGLEGLVLFIILWLFSRKPRPKMAVSGLFLLFYGIFRFFVEFFRTPDAHIGFIAFDWLTMGQILSAPMIVMGAIFLIMAYRRTVADS